MKNKTKTIFAITIGLTMIASVWAGIVCNNKSAIPADASVGNYTTNASTYYNGITATSGKELAAQLHDLITSTHKTYTTYDDSGRNLYQQDADQYYENGSKVNGYIYEFYSGTKWPNGWSANAGSTNGGYNREHCWCQSNSVNEAGVQMWGESGGGSDMHHIRPVETRLNSTRSNHPYGELPTNRDSCKVYAKLGSSTQYHGGYYEGDIYEPLDNKKGDVARILLYVYLHYNSYTNSTLFGEYGSTNGSGSSSYFTSSLLPLKKICAPSSESACLEMLLRWNESDPVDDSEIRRNNVVAKFQGNRNPFIDNQSYADMIWGSGASTDPTVNSVSIYPSNLNLDLQGTDSSTLTATVNVSNGAPTTVDWTSSNTSIATVSSSGVVTAVGEGQCTITATSTYNGNKKATCAVVVTNNGGGGGGLTDGEFSWDLKIASYDSDPTANLVTWSSDHFTMTNQKGTSNTAANNYLGGDSNDRTSSRFYNGNILTITPNENYRITSVVFDATSNDYASALGNSTFTNATSSVSGDIVTITPTNGTNPIIVNITKTCGFTEVKINYEYSGTVGPTLSSITLDTTNVQLSFTTGDPFNYSGLIVHAQYSDETTKVVTPSNVSSPSMFTAGTKTVTVSYFENNVTKTATYEITVTAPVATMIEATLDTILNPGDVINTEDINVVDDLGNEITDGYTFANDNYLVTYEDAPSGGTVGTKTFVNAVSYNSMVCDLTVSIQRENRTDITGENITDTLTADDFTATNTTYKDFDNAAKSSDAVYKGNSAQTSTGGIQLRSSNSNSGIVSTSSGGVIKSVSIAVESGTKTIDIYAKNTSYSAASDLYNNQSKGTKVGSLTSDGTIDFEKLSDKYTYVGIRSNNGAVYLTSIEIVYEGVGEDTAKNVANYIMYEDTNNQCQTKFDVAQGYFEGLSDSEKTSFMTSDDYVISTARTRFSAWATHLGKVITTDGDGKYIIQNAKFAKTSPDGQLNLQEDSSLMILFIICTLGAGSLSAFYLVKKKKKN